MNVECANRTPTKKIKKLKLVFCGVHISSQYLTCSINFSEPHKFDQLIKSDQTDCLLKYIFFKS